MFCHPFQFISFLVPLAVCCAPLVSICWRNFYILYSVFCAGNAGILKLFEGEPDHLIPSDSEELIENNLFTVAGRMIGHSFLHSGPSFPGLSPAIIHILFADSLEQSHLAVEDCPDLDIREMLRLVSKLKNLFSL